MLNSIRLASHRVYENSTEVYEKVIARSRQGRARKRRGLRQGEDEKEMQRRKQRREGGRDRSGKKLKKSIGREEEHYEEIMREV